ncbi:hypothetical protein HY604_05130 [Candidatus Peregrinibacteria bacterium]|nr:hypothetical protein [Candidatus Peregrinibacteria bacterium]
MFKKILLAGVFVLLVLGGGVYAWKFNVKSVEPEAVLPDDAFMVFELDFTNGNQRKLVRNLMKKFPEFELSDEAEESFFDDVMPVSRSNRKDLKNVLKGEWKLVVGLKIATGAGATPVADGPEESVLPEGLGVFAALKSDKIGKVENLVEHFLGKEAGGEYEKGKVDDVYFWKHADENFKVYRYGDSIFASSDPTFDNEMIARMKSGQAASGNAKLSVKRQGAALENLGFLFIDAEKGRDYIDAFARIVGFAQTDDFVSDAFLVAVASEEGIRMSGESGVEGDENYKLSLMDKVPGKGLIWYSEQADFSKVIAGMFSGFAASYAPVSGIDDPLSQLPGVYKTYDDALKDLEETFDGVSASELDKVFKSPFAMSFSYPGGFLPTMGIYLQLDEESLKAGDKLITALGNYSNEVVASFDKFVEEQGVPEAKGAVTQEVVSVQGGAARKVYLDSKKLPQELAGSIAAGLKMVGLDPDDIKLEFYYGVTGDNVLFVVFYPDFDKVYGTEFVSQQPFFQAALKDVESGGFMINFLTLSPMADMVGRYFAILKPLMALSPAEGEDAKKEAEDLKKSVKTVEDFLRTIKYFVDTQVFKDGIYRSDSFVRF